jgi:hypothetical protein
MKTPTCRDCAYCIDGMAPDGTHPDVGPVYIRCPYCIALGTLPACRECGDNAVFPADYTCLHCLLGALADAGLIAAICCSCAGVTYVTALPDEAGTP